MLAPYHLDFFAQMDFNTAYQLATKEPRQGKLIKEQDGMPMPMDPNEGKRYSPYGNQFPDKNYITYDPPLGSRGIPYTLPVLHCEIEGERIHSVCSTLARLLSLIPGGSFCRWKLFGIPFGRWTCAIIAAALLPIVVAALAIAWWAGSDDNRDFEGAGDLRRGESLIIRGRWVYDAGHSGYNELHPILFLQKIPDPGVNWTDFDALHDKWCKYTAEAPPIEWPGVHPVEMTPEQKEVHDRQQQAENRWELHPLIDGCQPLEDVPIVR